MTTNTLLSQGKNPPTPRGAWNEEVN
jgi:hypothetical protein